MVILPVAGIAAIILTQAKQQVSGALVLVAAWLILMLIEMLNGGSGFVAGFAGLMVAISMGALLVGDWTVIPTALLASIFFLVAGNSSGLFRTNTVFGDPRGLVFIALPVLLVHTGINYAFARSIRRLAAQIASDAEARSALITGAGGAIAQRLISTRLGLTPLLETAANALRDHLPDVHIAQIFLIDKERKNAMLVATTEASGKSQIGSQVGVGSLNVIGRVTIGGQNVVVRDSTEEQSYRRTAFLEGTRAELVIPLRVNNVIIGAIDMQSRNTDAFTPETVKAIDTVIGQVAAAIDNAKQYEESQVRLIETQRLYDQASSSLREIERLNQQLTGGAWTEYLRGMTAVPAFTIDPGTGRVEDAAEWTSTLAEATRRNQAISRASPQSKTLALPISVRGEVIGAMEFEIAPDQLVGSEQMVILQQVVERLGLAAENIRLLDEAQRIAQREAMVNEITARMQAATNVESVIATATQSIADAFQAPRVSIRLGMPQEGRAPSAGTPKNGNGTASGQA